MSDMVKHGSSGGGPSLPPGESHDEFLELCALATTNWLSAQEKQRLEAHLARCSACREAMSQYQAVAAHGITAQNLHAPSGDGADADTDWSLEEAEASLFARLDREAAGATDPESREAPYVRRPPAASAPVPLPEDSLLRHLWWQFAAGLLLASALGYSLYRTGTERGAEMARRAAPPAGERADAAHQTPTPSPAGVDRDAAALHQQKAQLTALRAELSRQSALIARLGAERAKLEHNLTGAEASQAGLAEARDNLARQRDAAQARLEDLQQRLEGIGAQNAADELKVAALNRQIEDLQTGTEQKDRELAREQELLDHDHDIRELMGSRNLYIAEVYDVARNGQTQRPFGRVFYTHGKSLIFYAYDLDQQPGLRETSTFQAWGRRGPDRDRAVNLGLFYIDSAAKKRWVLKSDNPRTLANIDAVFVTVEPHGGSSHPSGKPLLFAYLRIEPNHP